MAAIMSVLAWIVFIARGWRLPTNIIDLSLLRDRNFAGTNMAILGFGLAMYGAIAMLPLFVQGLLGYPVLEAGYLFMPRGLAAGFSMVFTGAVLVSRFDPRLLVVVGLTLTGTGNVALGWLDLSAGFWDLVIPGVVSGLGMGLLFVPMSTLAFVNIGAEKQDEATGLYSVMRSLGASIGIAIIGGQLAQRIQFHWNSLAAGVTPFDPATRAYLQPFNLEPGSHAAAARMASEVAAQAQMLAFQDVFMLSGIVAFLMLPTVLLMKRPKIDVSGAPTMAVH